MKTTRPISINNSLVHGICNYSCRLCSVNKPSYCGPRLRQDRETTELLVSRVEEAARDGVYVRYLANAGDGEPTLHPEFRQRMQMFGDMIRGWSHESVPPPEVSVVTNGLKLSDDDVLAALRENPLTLIVSFPTCDPEHYGLVMTGKPERGGALLSKVVTGLRGAMRLKARGELDRLMFHISPPERDIIRSDFDQTIDFLTDMARDEGVDELELVLFPATSNRAGLVHGSTKEMDMFKDLFDRYDGAEVHGVRVHMKLVHKRFFASTGELVDLLRCFEFPCIWNANLFLTADGKSICCNDQAARHIQGDVQEDTIKELIELKESFRPNSLCLSCDQMPTALQGSWAARVYATAARARVRWSSVQRRYSAFA